MTVQCRVALRNHRLDQTESFIGSSAVLEIRSGVQPVDCAAADSGTLLASIALPADAWGPASGGVKTFLGTWVDLSANASGNAGHWRLKSGGTVCEMQGSVTATGGGGDLVLNQDTTAIVAGQQFQVLGFTMTEGNA